MLKLRLARVGKRKKPFYRLMVSDNSKDMYGDHLENLGNYNPHNKEITLKEDRIKYWLSVGAQTSDTVHNLLVKQGIIKEDKVKPISISKKRQTKLDAKKPKPVEEKPVEAEAPVEPVVAQAETTEEQK